MSGRSHDADPLVGNVVFHAGFGVDTKLGLLINRASQAGIIIAGIFTLCVALGVVNVVFGTIAPETFGRDLELSRAVAKGHEAENAKKQSDSFGRHHLDGGNIDGLGVVTQPVAKVNSGDGSLVEFLAALDGMSHGQGEQRIFDVTVSPCRCCD